MQTEVCMAERKTIDELTLMDDYMFAQVMREPRYLKPLLEYVLQARIQEIRLIDTQHSEKEGYDSKGIRLDLYVTDEKNTVYNVEVQTYTKKSLPKRMHYYQSVIDISILSPGKDYEELKKSIVIFLCNYDPFGSGRYLYTFENRCKEEPALSLNDGTVKIVINTQGKTGGISPELREIITYLKNGQITGNFSRELDEAVNAVKSSEERRLEYMMLWERDNMMRAEGLEEGLARGKAEGLAEGKAEGLAEGKAEGIRGTVQILLKIGMNPNDITDQIMQQFHLSREEAGKYISEASEN